ncbi:hypothetical protein [Pseudanabaena sp. SR411]|uniref:hypothetical protein n=1 Tax=Pseudanabaena sp. SR411 TaxID=1980935 RepID=UPI001140696B|nr:hypothetical protein [Pseudanabaena sp. SR411]
MKFISVAVISAIAALSIPFSAQADSRKAYCRYFPNGASRATISMPCIFSMNQGNVGIRWEDGVSDYFLLSRDRPMTYTDERGGLVYQQRNEDANGESVRIFKMENGSIHIWGS